MSLLALQVDGLATVQDLGRHGWERFGVPVCGAMDGFALRATNGLVGNPPETAGLELALGELTLLAEDDLLLAASGRGWRFTIGGRSLPLWMAAIARRGEIIHLQPEKTAGWVYLAVCGGIATPPILGSRSTYLRGGFGGLEGRALQPDDRLPIGPHPGLFELLKRAGNDLPPALHPAYADHILLHLIPGPQADAFDDPSWQILLTSEYQLTDACDRMGYRLCGPQLQHHTSPDILSEGTPLGSVQVPGDGQPVILMADRQTTGGYAKIGVLASADLPLLAQCPPGFGTVRFARTTQAEAADRWRKLLSCFK